jgi:two-component system nitrate/nitrite response regulator NarL
MVTTVLVERNSLLRERLQRILTGTRFRVLKAAASLEELNVSNILSGRPILLLIGADKDFAHTICDVKRIKILNPASRIVLLSEDRDLDSFTSAFREGADGYICKRIKRDALMKSLSLVMQGQVVLPVEASRLLGRLNEGTTISRRLVSKAPVPFKRNLSERQTEILFSLMQGESNKAIARHFAISEATVKVHIRAILRIISVKNRTQAAIWALNHMVDMAEPRSANATKRH